MSKAPVQTDIAMRLKRARSRIFSTASEAAEALDMKPVTLRAHENAQNGISVYDLERYARRYNVSLQWLLTGQGEIEPDARVHVELGEMVDVEVTIEPNSWVPDDDPSLVRQKFRQPKVAEAVPYTDPRFPPGMVEAFRVGSASPLGHYIAGTILFCIDVSHGGFRSGDHVLVIRERGDFTNVSVRRAVSVDGQTIFESLTDPDEPALRWERTDKEELPHVSAVVIGSLTRRPVQAVDLEARKHFESYERSRRFGPKEWKVVTKEAQALVAGDKRVEHCEHFDTVDDARKWLASWNSDDD